MSARAQELITAEEEVESLRESSRVRERGSNGRTRLLIYMLILIGSNILTTSLTGIGVKDSLNEESIANLCSFRCRSSPVIHLDNTSQLNKSYAAPCIHQCRNGTKCC